MMFYVVLAAVLGLGLAATVQSLISLWSSELRRSLDD